MSVPLTENKHLHTINKFLTALWILPISSDPIKNGVVAVSDNKIFSVLDKNEFASLNYPDKEKMTVDFGCAAIMPGLINLHTHIDYSHLQHFDNYSSLLPWIEGLIQHYHQWNNSQWQASALSGAIELALSGTSCVADSSYSGFAADALSIVGLRGIVGLELFGLFEDAALATWLTWLTKYEKFTQQASDKLQSALKTKRIRLTVAPHAPHTVCPTLMSKSIDWSEDNNLPLLIHLAESDMECQWLAGHYNPYNQFLSKKYGEPAVCQLETASWRNLAKTPVEHMEHFGLLTKNIVASHLVKLTAHDIEILATRQINGVHCPRSNARLRNGISPFTRLMQTGLNLGFGTDSIASTDDLNILAEARFAWNLHRACNPDFDKKAQTALYYLTLGAAKALAIDSEVGSLEAGKYADIAVFSLPNSPTYAKDNPFESILYGQAKLDSLYVNASRIVHKGQLISLQ